MKKEILDSFRRDYKKALTEYYDEEYECFI